MKTKIERLQENNLKLRREIAQQSVEATLAENRFKLLLEVIAKTNSRLEGVESALSSLVAEKYLDSIRKTPCLTVRYELHVSDGAHKQWHAMGPTLETAVTNLRLMRGD